MNVFYNNRRKHAKGDRQAEAYANGATHIVREQGHGASKGDRFIAGIGIPFISRCRVLKRALSEEGIPRNMV